MKLPYIIICAPSGAGKTTIVMELLKYFLTHLFSISATTRKIRGEEIDGKNYYFLDEETFRNKIKEDGFAEYEEVYPGRFYGTLKSEIKRIEGEGKKPIFDVDVEGALKLKKFLKAQNKPYITIFIAPPSFAVLEERLRKRGTETEEQIQTRLGKAMKEMSKAHLFDLVVVNDKLADAVAECRESVKAHLVR